MNLVNELKFALRSLSRAKGLSATVLLTLALGIGVGIGLAASFAGSRVLTTMLFQISPHDPSTFGAIAVLLVLVAWAASYIPGRRATRVDPIVALRVP